MDGPTWTAGSACRAHRHGLSREGRPGLGAGASSSFLLPGGGLRLAAVLVAAAALFVALALAAAGGLTSDGSGRSSDRSAGRAPTDMHVALARVERGLVEVTTSSGCANIYGRSAGMVIGADGLVLTSLHAVDGAVGIAVRSVATGRIYGATVEGYDRSADVAVLRLDAHEEFPTVPLGRSARLAVGAPLSVVGRSRATPSLPRVSRGVVTGLDCAVLSDDTSGVHTQLLAAAILTDARVVCGDSGGPVLDASGRVVGMIAACSARPDRPSRTPTGFAVPIDEALAVARRIEAGEASAEVHIGPTAFLGVAAAPLRTHAGDPGESASPAGAVVVGVVPGYPAAAAGLEAGDVIVSVAGRQVSAGAGITDALTGLHPGDRVQVVWEDRDGAVCSATLRLAAGPPA